MPRQKGQKMRFNDAELELFKKVFADNEDLLFIIRKVLLQIDLLEHEQKILDENMSDGVHEVIKKSFLGGIDPDSPLTQIADLRRTYAMEMQNKTEEEMQPIIEAKELQISYLEQQFEVLKGGEKGDISLSNMSTPPISYIKIKAWNDTISFIDARLQEIQTLAGEKEETVDETIKRLEKDSSK